MNLTPVSLAALAVGIASRATIRELPTDLDIKGSRDHAWQSRTLLSGRRAVPPSDGLSSSTQSPADTGPASVQAHPRAFDPTLAVFKRNRRSPLTLFAMLLQVALTRPPPLRLVSRRRHRFAQRPSSIATIAWRVS
jgi:hypothetical protein